MKHYEVKSGGMHLVDSTDAGKPTDDPKHPWRETLCGEPALIGGNWYWWRRKVTLRHLSVNSTGFCSVCWVVASLRDEI